jgi:DNA polymerase III subunit delta
MKVTGRSIESFLRDPGAVAAALFYGPDTGLVRERADRLAAAVAGDAADPFRVSEVTVDRLRDQPSLLSDEAAALSFGGGRRVVRLRSAGDGQAAAIKSLLDSPVGGGLVIVEADELGPRSSLRQLFEAADNAAALPCYRDEAGDLARLIGEELGRAGLRLTDEARDYLVSALGGDRGVTRRELEKIVSYMGPAESAQPLELADAVACVGDSAALSVDDLVYAIGDGDLMAVERLVDRVLAEGTSPVTILRTTGRHFLRVHLLASAEDRERAIRSLKPPVFYKYVARLHDQVRQWAPPRLQQALDRLTRAEMDCKRTGMPADVLCRRALLEIAAQAPRRARTG